jgi:hypothetical protein
MIRTQIYLTEKQYRVLKEKSHAENEPIAVLVRDLVEKEFFHDKKKDISGKKDKNADNWLLKMAEEAEKSGAHGPTDLASNVDAYLYGGKK